MTPIARALELIALCLVLALIAVIIPHAYFNWIAVPVALLWGGWLAFRATRDTIRRLK